VGVGRGGGGRSKRGGIGGGGGEGRRGIVGDVGGGRGRMEGSTQGSEGRRREGVETRKPVEGGGREEEMGKGRGKGKGEGDGKGWAEGRWGLEVDGGGCARLSSKEKLQRGRQSGSMME